MGNGENIYGDTCGERLRLKSKALLRDGALRQDV
jgi:hypothetical protein